MLDIVELIKQEVINRSNSFEQSTKNTKDEYNLYKEHIQYVYKYATLIIEELDVDIEVVKLSALLHDISMTDSSFDREKHNEYSSIIAEELLLKENYDKEKIEKIKLCILNHSSKRKEYRTTKEEQVLVDADAMAHFDCIESLYSLANKVIGLNDKDSLNFVKEKLTKDYNEISDNVKKYISDKYENVMKSKSINDILNKDKEVC